MLNIALLEGNPFICFDMVETMDSDSSSLMELYDEIIKKEGERFVMCEAFERWMKENKEVGRIEGKLEGKIEGKAEGERNCCIKML